MYKNKVYIRNKVYIKEINFIEYLNRRYFSHKQH
jgi:hypothetical protein